MYILESVFNVPPKQHSDDEKLINSSFTSVLSFYRPFSSDRSSSVGSCLALGHTGDRITARERTSALPPWRWSETNCLAGPRCHTEQAYMGARCCGDIRGTNRDVGRTGRRLGGIRRLLLAWSKHSLIWEKSSACVMHIESWEVGRSRLIWLRH